MIHVYIQHPTGTLAYYSRRKVVQLLHNGRVTVSIFKGHEDPVRVRFKDTKGFEHSMFPVTVSLTDDGVCETTHYFKEDGVVRSRKS